MKRESRAGNSFNTLILFIYLCILIFFIVKKIVFVV